MAVVSRSEWLALALERAEAALSKLRRPVVSGDDLAEIEDLLHAATEHCKDAARALKS